MTAQDASVVFDNARDRAGILDEWRWLIGTHRQPLRFTASGNAFVEDRRDGSVHFLDANREEITQVAPSRAAFDMLLADPGFVEAYFNLPLIRDLRARGLLLAPNEIYSFRTPWSLGGDDSPENVEAIDAEVHFSIAGQIARQIASLPDGSPIPKLEIRMPRRTKPWWRFW